MTPAMFFVIELRFDLVLLFFAFRDNEIVGHNFVRFSPFQFIVI
jgi:hypothetical protein